MPIIGSVRYAEHACHLVHHDIGEVWLFHIYYVHDLANYSFSFQQMAANRGRNAGKHSKSNIASYLAS